MHSNSILNSSLLDIIFDNRNKDYGAYILRRDYPKRLFQSLATVFALAAIFACWQMLSKKNGSTKVSLVNVIPGPSISSIKKVADKPAKTIQSRVKPAKALQGKPVIVNNDLAAKAARPSELLFTSPGGNEGETPPVETPDPLASDDGATQRETPQKASAPVVDINVPVNSPEVLPQYPGGISELIKFLRKNLTAPRELEEGEKVSVKVRFLVNYEGVLTGFSVVETGGEAFDNEVIRVLKKMPDWVPGKTGGESVSAYFMIPVIFTLLD